eukprot:GHVU01118641.1.p1 GENE.GHVU01118641.1~~GHVU01118641.1.p1  ORF type:complete len:128 (+),score=4.09 GHVU01118641.1:526-909(+)
MPTGRPPACPIAWLLPSLLAHLPACLSVCHSVGRSVDRRLVFSRHYGYYNQRDCGYIIYTYCPCTCRSSTAYHKCCQRTAAAAAGGVAFLSVTHAPTHARVEASVLLLTLTPIGRAPRTSVEKADRM